MPKATNRWIWIVAFAANGAGAFLTFLYFQVIDPLPTDRAVLATTSQTSVLVFAGLMAALSFIAFSWGYRISSQIANWERRLQDDASSHAPTDVQRRALNYIPQVTLISLVMWLLAGVVFGLYDWWGGRSVSYILREFVGIVGVGGVLTTALLYFVADLVWRRSIPAFFPQGNLSTVSAFRLPVLGRLLIVFLLVGLWPLGLLVRLSLERAEALITAPNPEAVLGNLFALELFILGVSALVSVGMAVFVTRSIVDPLHTLQAAMGHVEEGDLAVQVPVTTNDELGYLAERFNQMTAGLRQGEMLRTLLNLYVSPEVARAAVQHGAALGGTLVECTVLFSDIRGFTGLSEQLSPVELIDTLNRYMSAMVAVIVKHGGIVNKFGGDSILAVYGTPLNPAPDHAARAVQTARGMRRALAEFNQVQTQADAPVLETGIGIATGIVVAGNVGGRERLEYTVIGDTVNLAARLQDLTKELGHAVLLSATTHAAAVQTVAVDATRLPPVTVRGKREPVTVYALVENT